MGVFFSKATRTKDGKEYVVYKSKPWMHSSIVIILLGYSLIFWYKDYFLYRGGYYSHAFFVIILSSFALFGIRSFEYWKAGVGFTKSKTNIIKKGDSLYNSTNPAEYWILLN